MATKDYLKRQDTWQIGSNYGASMLMYKYLTGFEISSRQIGVKNGDGRVKNFPSQVTME